MKRFKAFDKTHLKIFGEKKIFDVISIDFRAKSVLLDAGKYGEIKRQFSEVELLQFTELNDKDIYEGHIVKTTMHGYEYDSLLVVFYQGCFGVKYLDEFQPLFEIIENGWDIEIIGDIYETPYL